jgi:hypothetical protein
LQCVDGGEYGPISACIRAEDVALTRDLHQASGASNRIVGRVRSVLLEGPLARIEIDCGFLLVAVITAQSAGELALRTGEAGLRHRQGYSGPFAGTGKTLAANTALMPEGGSANNRACGVRELQRRSPRRRRIHER